MAVPIEMREGAGPSRALLYVLLGVMVTFWSINFVVAKFALREFPPLLLAGVRVALSGLCILPVYLWQRARSPHEVWGPKDVPTLIYLGVFGVALNQLFFVLGISRTSVAHSGIIIATSPICVLLIAAAMKQEHITARKAIGMGLALLGVALLNLSPARATGGSAASLSGDILIFLAGLTFAAFTVMGKRVSTSHSSITVNTFAYVGGAFAFAPVTLWLGRDFAFSRVSVAGWISLAYMVVFPSVICYLIYYYALTHIPASRVAAFAYIQPVLTTVLATITLDERVTLPLVAGGAVIFTGVYLAERG